MDEYLNILPEEHREAARKQLAGLNIKIIGLESERETMSSKNTQLLDEYKKNKIKFEGIDLDKYNDILKDETFIKNK